VSDSIHLRPDDREILLRQIRGSSAPDVANALLPRGPASGNRGSCYSQAFRARIANAVPAFEM
jgi:hypothetical protein